MKARKPHTLIIVESPTKAKTISKFVGSGYTVKSSFGHIRDLPKRQLGIDVAKDFEPSYVIPLKAKSVVSGLKKDAAKATRVVLATDEDREGEAIAWHLAKALGLTPKVAAPQDSSDADKQEIAPEKETDKKPEAASKKKEAPPAERITFDEITKKAILAALEHPRIIDQQLVDAQQGRRVLDRLVGYKLSPLLWKKISKGLSAGRVQSVAVKFVADRERERQAFKPEEYWTIESLLSKKGVSIPNEKIEGAELPEGVFIAKLSKVEGKTVEKFDLRTATDAERIKDGLKNTDWKVADIVQKEVKRNPFPPFTTSTLQQTAGRRFGFSSAQTMRLAQMLYEGADIGEEGTVGLITYMRTDSLHLSEESLQAAVSYINETFGPEYSEGAPRQYKTKSRLAQEAHEAIRPSDPRRTPEAVKPYLEARMWKLYDLIWRRFVASQMPSAKFLETTVSVAAGECVFEARGIIKKFDGYQRVYPVKMKESVLPDMAKNEILKLVELRPLQHFTEPPPRYNEASLVKTLEEHGIGRPSTYAPTMFLIQNRGYVKKDERKAFFPTEVGLAVNDLLQEHFPLIVDAKFTAKMEEDLDRVASGEVSWREVIGEFYGPFEKQLAEKQDTITKMIEETSDTCEKCGKPMIIRMGRFGRFMACSGFPDCKNAKPLPASAAGGESASGEAQTTENGGAQIAEGEKCEKCGSALVERRGRFGPFVGCSKYPECNYIKKKQYTIGVKCPKCKDGDVVSRRTKSRRIFYGCSKYPECDFASWARPGVEGAEEKKEAAEEKK
jgi:DNA topoisomerase I